MRETLRRARAYGASKADQILFGRISAKMGLTIALTDRVPGGKDGRSAIVALDDGKMYVTAERRVITGATKAQQRAQITEFFNKLLAGNKSLEIETIEGDVLTITKAETAKKARDDYKYVDKQRVPLSDDEFKVKLNAEAHIDELSQIAESEKRGKNDSKNHSFATGGFTYRTAYFEDFDGGYYKITLSIGHNGTVATVYSVGKIEKSVPSSAKIIAVVGSKALDETLSGNSIPNSKQNVKASNQKSSRSALDSSDNVAFFDGKNTIYLDANAPRTRSYKGLLGHEVWHKMFKSSRIADLFNSALDNIDPGKRAEVKEMYTQHLRELGGRTEAEIENISDEEVAAAYAEELFNNPHIWDIVLDGEPTLKDKVLAFFKLAPKRYSFAPEMEPAAKEWIREYKKLFDEISADNRSDSAVKVIGRITEDGESQAVRVIGRVTEDNVTTTDDSYATENADSDGVTTTNQQKMQDSGRSAIKKKEYEEAAVNSQIIALAEKIQSSEFKQNDKVFLKNLTDDVAKKITELTGVDVKGFKVAIEARQLEHIMKRHGKNGLANASMSNIVDIAKMEYALQSPDSLTLSGKTQAYSYMKNGYNRTADTVLYEKDIGEESYYVVQAVADTKAKTLYIVGAFKGEQGYKKGASQLINAKIPDATSENGSVVTPDNSILDPKEKINSSDKNSSKNVDSGGRAALRTNKKTDKAVVKLKADYKTDTVFSQASVNRAFSEVEALSSLPKERQKDFARRIDNKKRPIGFLPLKRF